MRSRSHSDPSTVRARRRRALGAVATVAALAASALVVPAAHAADEVTINLVTINDFHGRIEAAPPSGGIAALSTAVAQVRASNPNTLFASAGDNIGASTFTSFIQQDDPTIDTLNLTGLDVSAVGNHEFDRGFADLTDRVIPRATFPYLGANVYLKGTTTPALQEYMVKEVDGVRIGFIGAVTSELPSLVSPAGIATVDIGDIPAAVNRVADALKDGDPDNGEADIVVALVHEGAATSNIADAENPATPMGHIVTATDAQTDMIVSAHTHVIYNHEIGGRPVIQAGQYGERFDNSTITFDRDTRTISSISTVSTPMYDTTTTPPSARFAPDPAVAEIVASAVAVAKVEGGKKVGDVTADFNRGIQPRTPTADNPATTQEARGAESTLGNFVADVQLWTAQRTVPGTQIAFMNPGGLRTDLKYASSGATDPAGNVTYAEAAAVQPFANTLVTLTLSGDQVRQVLEQQWQPAAAARPFLKLGVSKGLTYTADYAAPAGSRVQNLRFGGVPVDPASAYQVVVNSFLASGGDNFGVFAQGTSRADTGQIDLQGMVDWFAANATATPDPAQRSIGVTASSPADGVAYAAGEGIALQLSSLEFTTSEVPAGTVAVAIGGVAVGSAAVDRTPVVNDDRAGRATLTVTVPAGLSGAVPLTITTPAGTSFEVPIQVAAPIVKVASTTLGWPGALLVKKGRTIPYTVLVRAAGQTPTGEVTIYDGTKSIATVILTAADKGRVTVALTGLGRGIHRLSAVYGGSDEVEQSRSAWLPVLVL